MDHRDRQGETSPHDVSWVTFHCFPDADSPTFDDIPFSGFQTHDQFVSPDGAPIYIQGVGWFPRLSASVSKLRTYSFKFHNFGYPAITFVGSPVAPTTLFTPKHGSNFATFPVQTVTSLTKPWNDAHGPFEIGARFENEDVQNVFVGYGATHCGWTHCQGGANADYGVLKPGVGYRWYIPPRDCTLQRTSSNQRCLGATLWEGPTGDLGSNGDVAVCEMRCKDDPNCAHFSFFKTGGWGYCQTHAACGEMGEPEAHEIDHYVWPLSCPRV